MPCIPPVNGTAGLKTVTNTANYNKVEFLESYCEVHSRVFVAHYRAFRRKIYRALVAGQAAY